MGAEKGPGGSTAAAAATAGDRNPTSPATAGASGNIPISSKTATHNHNRDSGPGSGSDLATTSNSDTHPKLPTSVRYVDLLHKDKGTLALPSRPLHIALPPSPISPTSPVLAVLAVSPTGILGVASLDSAPHTPGLRATVSRPASRDRGAKEPPSPAATSHEPAPPEADPSKARHHQPALVNRANPASSHQSSPSSRTRASTLHHHRTIATTPASQSATSTSALAPSPTIPPSISASAVAAATKTSRPTSTPARQQQHQQQQQQQQQHQTAPPVTAAVAPASSTSNLSKRPPPLPDSPNATASTSNGGATDSKSLLSSASQVAATATSSQARDRRDTSASETPNDVATPSSASHAAHDSSSRPPSVDTVGSVDNPIKEWAFTQRQLLLPKSVEAAKSDESKDKRKSSRPPVSYRPPNLANQTSGRAHIPPIRSFRSSGSRKSIGLDLHSRRMSDESSTYGGEEQRDRTLRALEGRTDDDASQAAPSSSDRENDNTADIFMNLAHEDKGRRPVDGHGLPDDRGISRVSRSFYHRPLSTTIVPSVETSPPQVSRRLSDQRENAPKNSRPAQQMARELASRATSRDRPVLSYIPTDDFKNASSRASVSLRPSPITPRHNSDASSDIFSVYQRRRPSLTGSGSGSGDSSLPPTSRASQIKNANIISLAQGRTYNSSPLVPKTADASTSKYAHHSSGAGHGVEGTESSTSTAAPSTVWDELDDLKSRINRLEITGKMPITSGAAMSQASNERPTTATTATTTSGSPRRNPPGSAAAVAAAAAAEAVSTTSFHRESQPILLSALHKTKGLLNEDVFNPIQSAAADALTLSSMLGVAGQPGPISSGASTIGQNGTITDRQLRRKVDSICRNLTELCLALADERGRGRQMPQAFQAAPPPPLTTAPPPPPPPQPAPPIPVTVPPPRQLEREGEPESMESPRARTLASAKRTSILLMDSIPGVPKLPSSPRAPTSLEQRRFSMLHSSTYSSPRVTIAPTPGPVEHALPPRKASMLLSRSRRAVTEEPEEVLTGRKSSMLRTRRTGTEELEDQFQREREREREFLRETSRDPPRDGHKSSLLFRSRKPAPTIQTNNEHEESSRFRAPSRAVTEVNGMRGSRDYNVTITQQQQTLPSPPDASSLGLPALPRRRFMPSSLNSRLSIPASSTTVNVPGGRRYLERGSPERDTNSVAEKLAEDRGQRQPTVLTSLGRRGSLSRRRAAA